MCRCMECFFIYSQSSECLKRGYMRNAGRDILVQFYKGSTQVKCNCLMKALHSCEFLEDFLLLFKVLLNLPLTGCNQLNGGLRYTKILMSGTEVCLLYHACQSVPPILPDAQCGQRGGIEGSLAIEIERTKKTAMNIMDVRKERANRIKKGKCVIFNPLEQLAVGRALLLFNASEKAVSPQSQSQE